MIQNEKNRRCDCGNRRIGVGFHSNIGAVATETCQAEDWQFTKTGLMALCPTISKSSVENAIKKLIEEGILVKHGSGRAVYYTRSDAE